MLSSASHALTLLLYGHSGFAHDLAVLRGLRCVFWLLIGA